MFDTGQTSVISLFGIASNFRQSWVSTFEPVVEIYEQKIYRLGRDLLFERPFDPWMFVNQKHFKRQPSSSDWYWQMTSIHGQTRILRHHRQNIHEKNYKAAVEAELYQVDNHIGG